MAQWMQRTWIWRTMCTVGLKIVCDSESNSMMWRIYWALLWIKGMLYFQYHFYIPFHNRHHENVWLLFIIVIPRWVTVDYLLDCLHASLNQLHTWCIRVGSLDAAYLENSDANPLPNTLVNLLLYVYFDLFLLCVCNFDDYLIKLLLSGGGPIVHSLFSCELTSYYYFILFKYNSMVSSDFWL